MTGSGSTGSVIGFLSLFLTKFASPARPTLTQSTKPQKPRSAAKPSQLGRKGTYAQYSLPEVALHNSQDDCWIIVDGKVHDVTNLRHPGPFEKVGCLHAMQQQQHTCCCGPTCSLHGIVQGEAKHTARQDAF